jgi:tubulin polyglutamylase TTLL6/13
MGDANKKKSTSKKIAINLANCKYEVLKIVSKELGFQIVEDGQPWVLDWIDTGVSYERVLTMNSYQKINHFPGMHEICRKDHLARKVSKLSKLFPKEYNFFPQSWILPTEWNDFNHSFKPKKGQCFISKPDHGCQGKGITLFRTPSNILNPSEKDAVVQAYISNPFLINGFKFDFRVYVLVTSVNPLRVFVYKDGLARFATERYHNPSEKNLSRLCMHLTNYAINKNSDAFIRDDEKGSKRTIKSVLNEMKEKYNADVDLVWKRIKDVIVKTVISVQPALSKFPKQWFPLDPSRSIKNCGSQCFEILGFDILLDTKLKPWVLEVNHSPSFACDSKLDFDIKSNLIKEALQLVNLSVTAVKKTQKDEKQKSISRLISKSKTIVRKDSTVRQDSEVTISAESNDIPQIYLAALEKYHQTYNPTLLDKLQKWENARIGYFDRAFPPSDMSLLGKYLHLISKIDVDHETTSIKNKKAYMVAQQEIEDVKKKKLAIWKLKQKKSSIQSKIGVLLDQSAEMKALLDFPDVRPSNRSHHAHHLKFNSEIFTPKSDTFSTTYTSRSSENSKRASLQISKLCLLKQSFLQHKDNFIIPIIQQKKKELNNIQTTMNNRSKVLQSKRKENFQ